MFAKAVIHSGRFLQMPASARLLYYDLGMCADDDGFADAFRVLKSTGSRVKNLEILEDNGFIRILSDSKVVYINDWNVNNQIRKDRYRPSIYRGLLPVEDSADVTPVVNHGETQYRIGKDSIGKDRKEKDSIVQYSSGKGDAAPGDAVLLNAWAEKRKQLNLDDTAVNW